MLFRSNLLVYVDVDQDILSGRYDSRPNPSEEELFRNPNYNKPFREYFMSKMPELNKPKILVLNGEEKTSENVKRIISFLEDFGWNNED